MVNCNQDGSLEERTGLREDAEASLEHGECEGLKTPRGRYQEATEPSGLRLRVVEAGDRCRNQGHEVGVKRRPALRNQPKDINILSVRKDLGSG